MYSIVLNNKQSNLVPKSFFKLAKLHASIDTVFLDDFPTTLS